MPIHVAVNSYAESRENWARLLESVQGVADSLTIVEGRYPLHPALPETRIPLDEYPSINTTLIMLDADEITKRNRAYEHLHGRDGYLLWLDADEEFVIHNYEKLRAATDTYTTDAITVAFHTVTGPLAARFNKWESPGQTITKPRLFSLDGRLQCGPAHYHHTIERDGQRYNLWPIRASRKLGVPDATVGSLEPAAEIRHYTLQRPADRVLAKHEYTNKRNAAGIEK